MSEEEVWWRTKRCPVLRGGVTLTTYTPETFRVPIPGTKTMLLVKRWLQPGLCVQRWLSNEIIEEAFPETFAESEAILDIWMTNFEDPRLVQAYARAIAKQAKKDAQDMADML